MALVCAYIFVQQDVDGTPVSQRLAFAPFPFSNECKDICIFRTVSTHKQQVNQGRGGIANRRRGLVKQQISNP